MPNEVVEQVLWRENAHCAIEPVTRSRLRNQRRNRPLLGPWQYPKREPATAETQKPPC